MDAGGGSPAGTFGRPRLPAVLTRFVGRQAEVAELDGVLSEARLVTLVGSPGGGKTRLSLELVDRLSVGFRDGASFVDLAPISDARLVADVTARALEIAEDPGRSVADTLAERLADAELLLVLDNCEHVLAAVADLAERLLVASPSLRIVATSRVALGLPGERVWRVLPLDCDAAADLFVDRAVLAAGSLELDSDARALVEQVCDGLDRLPLAIELAAPWTRVLSLSQIVERLERALPLQRAGRRVASPRHRTMESAIGWSYRLLSGEERALLDRLSVFAGTFDLAAAGAVAGPDGDVLERLTSLVDHSLVIVEPLVDEPMRYRLLEVVRQYGAVRLAAEAETDRTRQAHAEHFLAEARRVDEVVRADRRAGVRLVERDDANFHAALEWARRHRADVGLRIGVALAYAWELGGRVNDGAGWLEELLTIDTADRRLRVTALARAGRLAWRQQRYPLARARLRESLALAEELGDSLAVARRLRGLTLVALSEGDVATAADLGARCVAIFARDGDERGRAWALYYVGMACYVAGDVDRGDSNMREALAAARAAGDAAATAYSLLGLTYGAGVVSEDHAAARRHFAEGVTVLREAGGFVEDPDWLWAAFGVALFDDRPRAALRLAGGAAALGGRGGTHMAEAATRPLGPLIEQARRAVGPAAADRLVAKGARMTVDELMADALAGPAEPDAVLSRREREVAQLVGAGLTNREIASTLFISPRTVESHVDHIKTKLDLATRAQIVAWAVREGPDGEVAATADP
jgi:predicted ATPase/DNA-binding CsgD family transcriptional regulator